MVAVPRCKCGLRVLRFALLLAVVSLVLPSVAVAQGTAPTDAAIKEQLQRLDPKNDKTVRLEALKWLGQHEAVKNAGLAIPVLERCIREDPDSEVRCSAAYPLCGIALQQNKPCPLALVEALLDKDEQVALSASNYVGAFKTYPPGALEILLRCVRSPNSHIRSGALWSLFQAGGKDKRVLEALEKAKQDAVFEVRHNAHAVMFQIDDNLASFLGYLLRLRGDPDGVLGPIDKDSEAGKRSLTHRNLARIGMAVLMVEWSEKRANDFALALLKYLENPSPLLRGGAASLIGACVVRVEPPPDLKELFERPFVPWWSQGPYTDPPKGAKKPTGSPQKSKVAIRLEELKVKERLRRLADNDPDLTVRDAARYALARFAMVEQKKR
ncbi:MAG TPA: HEAT repeat domain-containing protein [Gemmataceae bacterium]|nr:HEAT repeat domain-containing protein [Gemmataceae bacterium]